MWADLLNDNDVPDRRRRGRLGGAWEDIKGALLRAVQPAIDVAKAPIEEAAEKSARAGALGGILAGALVTALVVRRKARD